MSDRLDDKTALASQVSLTIAGELRRQTPLDLRIASRRWAIRAQVVSECQVLAPQSPSPLNQMNVIRARLTASKELMTYYAAVPPVLITSPLERRDILEDRHCWCVAGQDVEYRLRAESRHGGAADVLESQRELRNRAENARGLGRKESRPALIIFDESHDP